jgi:hypothetical protein
MPAVTLNLSPRAYAYAKRKTGYKRYGTGAFISEVLARAEAKEEALEQMRQALDGPPATATRQSWAETGLRVD